MSMTKIQLHMFIDQNKKKSAHSGTPPTASLSKVSLPFNKWKVGHIIKGNGSSGEEWTINKIDSADGTPKQQECTITLINAAQEKRELKGRSVAVGYDFVSHGDVPPDAAEPLVTLRNDIQYLLLDPSDVREVYPRKHGAEGTRLIMHDKTAYIVADGYNDVLATMMKAGVAIVTADENNVNRDDA